MRTPVDRRRTRRRLTGVLAALCALLVALPAGAHAAATFTTSPALSPSFTPGVTDYVVRCNNSSVQVNVDGDSTSRVSLDGGPAKKGDISSRVSLRTGKAFTVVIGTQGSSTTTTYWVRCLPSDFPQYTATKTGTPQAEFYVTGLGLTINGTPSRYAAIFDTNGVPMWWYPSDPSVMDAKLLPDGNMAWGFFTSQFTGYQVRRLDGSLVRTYTTIGLQPDPHELIQESNGNVIMQSYTPRPGTVDLSAYGGPATGATVIDCIIQEITPSGQVVFQWNSKDHIGLDETDPNWWSQVLNNVNTLPDGRKLYDPWHMNSVDPIGNYDLLVSFRHTDSVYRIHKSDGSFMYKLGGTPRPESLTVKNDPVFDGGSGFGGQHDARQYSNGSVSIYDNGSTRGRPPRAVQYAVNPSQGTATLVKSMSDPAGAPTSPCCGSARPLFGSQNDWVVSWGGEPLIGEYTLGGDPVFKLSLAGGLFSYRAQPLMPGVTSASALRNGMNSQYPNH